MGLFSRRRRSQGRQLLRDVTHLQIDTILAEGISGRELPEYDIALAQIAERYRETLVRLGEAVELPKREDGSTRAGKDAFELLARKARTAKEGRLLPRDAALASRIDTGSTKLARVLASLGDDGKGKLDELPWGAEDRVAVRRYWELGTHSIVMQTVIGIDGDVVNRVQEGYASASHEPIHELHARAVAQSLRTWEALVNTLSSFLSTVGRRGR